MYHCQTETEEKEQENTMESIENRDKETDWKGKCGKEENAPKVMT